MKKTKNRDINLVTTERHIIISYDKFFTENLLAIKMKKTKIVMNKNFCLGLSVLENINVWVLVWLCKSKIW